METSLWCEMVEIIKATRKHLYAITVLTREFFPYTNFNLDKIAQRLAEKDIEYYVAVVNKATVGFVDIEFKDKQATILGLAVAREFQNKGIGSKLLQKALDRIAEKKCDEVLLLVSEDNLGARKLYERFGFYFKGRLARRIWNKRILVFRKVLTP
ncbi:MAG: GNAT family N-acetyltransferase [Candidatus Micrarchaeota archaeon]